MLEKTEGSTKKGHSRDTGNIEHTRHRTKAIKPQNTTQHRKLKKKEKHGPYQQPGVNSGAREGYAENSLEASFL